jgi:hypothetical protein
MGRERRSSMATDLLKRLNDVTQELERQNAAWDRARRVLSEIGEETVPVTRGFFEELDSLACPLAPCPSPSPSRLRV